MGSYLSSVNKAEQQSDECLAPENHKSKKRKLNEFRVYQSDSVDTIETFQEETGLKAQCKNFLKPELVTPCKKKMKSTTNYIYKTLFVDGENSDIKVRALNKNWFLHKLYLCQSPYFDSMFKGCKWKESNQTFIQIAIPDQNITVNGLNIAFGSFYREEIEIRPIEVINVLACASLFSLDGLITQCEAIMLENIGPETVVEYYDAANLYGVIKVTQTCLKWLCQNIMINEEIRLNAINLVLFEKVLNMFDLMIIQVETDLYSLCKKWLYFTLMQSSGSSITKLDSKSWQKIANDFFKNLLKDKDKCLLEYNEYKIYTGIFRKIRLQHVITDLPSLRLLYNDRIIPADWIEPYYAKNWLNLLFIDQDRLSNEFEIELEDFQSQSLRFGRVLHDDQPATWRWVGFNFGADLLVTHAARTITLKRNTINLHSPYKGLLSNKILLRIYYIIKLVELDSSGNELWSKKTDLTCLDLNRSEEKYIISIDHKVKYPIMLNLMVSVHPFCHNYVSAFGSNDTLNESQI